MKIAPIDIAHKTFDKKLMGLHPDEVAEYLRAVAAQMEELIRERNTLKESLREKELSILDYKERDESLKSTIETATKMSHRITADADREAKLIVSDASQRAEMIIKDARDSLKRIYQDISDLKKTRLQFEHNLKALVGAHLAMIEQGHQIMPNPSGPIPPAQPSANVTHQLAPQASQAMHTPPGQPGAALV